MRRLSASSTAPEGSTHWSTAGSSILNGRGRARAARRGSLRVFSIRYRRSDAAPRAAVHAAGASPLRAPPVKTARGGLSCARIVRATASDVSARSEEGSRGHARVASAHSMCISPMHSPGGGASTALRTPPHASQCDISRESHGVPSGDMDISFPPHCAPHERMAPMMNHDMPVNVPCVNHAPDIQRAYAHFMSFHMHQGLTHEQAFHMWVGYAHRTFGVTIVP